MKTLTKPNKILFTQVALTCLYLLVLFLGIMSYFYGSLFRSEDRAHNLNILAVDYDGSAIGQALQTAYSRLKSPGFVSLHFQPPSAFPINSIGQSAICSHGYWAAIYTHPGATERLRAAISGADSYNPNDTITFVYNGVYYPVISQAYIAAELQALSAATTQIFHAQVGRELFQSTNATNTAISALLEPIHANSIVLYSAEQGTRVLLNTITMVAPPLMQFFYVMALDHISAAVGTFRNSQKHHIYLTRLIASNCFSFVGALVVTAFIYAFRESWYLTGSQFVETWLCFWFYMAISYLVMDSFIGTIVPMRYAPFFIFSWVIVNVTSTLFPFELSPGFYRWGYALPAHNVWLLLMQIWSDGCISRLQIALPVLFVWWLIGHFTSAYAVRKKCAMAQHPANQHGPPAATGDGKSSPESSKEDSKS